jgi:hypothetical protein
VKGVFSSSEATHSISIQGEAWRQGDPIDISVSTILKDKKFDNWFITVAFVDMKKLKKNNDNSAFKVLNQSALNSSDTKIKLTLNNNAPISDGQSVLMVLCGDKDHLESSARLELSVSHHPLFEDFIQTLALFHRFQLKTLKNKKNTLDAKFTLPKTREYGAIEQLNITMCYEKESLQTKCIFKVKKLEYTGSGVEAKLTKIEEDFTYSAKSLVAYGSFNQETIKIKMSEILERVKTKTLI